MRNASFLKISQICILGPQGTCFRYQIEVMFRQSQGSQFALVWEFKQITYFIKKEKKKTLGADVLPIRGSGCVESWMQLCIFPQQYSESTWPALSSVVQSR